jgi:hypothetical protein
MPKAIVDRLNSELRGAVSAPEVRQRLENLGFEVAGSSADEFSKVIKDLIRDVKVTFPEVCPLIGKWWKDVAEFNYIDSEVERTKAFEESQQAGIKFLFTFCQKKFPPRFFEILYQNDEMFKADSDIDTEFLPNINFKNLWQCDISKKTRDIIWKYLQLILISIVSTLQNKDEFGDTAKMFEAINENEFKQKLEETLSHMQNLFDSSGNIDEASEDFQNIKEGFKMNDLPDPNEIHQHITGMLDGKLGKLAREIAEETAESTEDQLLTVPSIVGSASLSLS